MQLYAYIRTRTVQQTFQKTSCCIGYAIHIRQFSFRIGSRADSKDAEWHSVQNTSVSKSTAKQLQFFVASVDFVDLECNLEEKAYASSCSIRLHLGQRIRRPAGVSCGSCLFVVVQYCLSCLLSSIPLSNLNPCPPLPSLPSASPRRSVAPSSWFAGFNSAHALPNVRLVFFFFAALFFLPSLLCLPYVCSGVSYIQYLI